ncbi:DUF5808 domain-containing protein [Solirubrobacter soli]|uniref:DUF5808 domain-containing protein n=1 Tax=Solirubrobacter soli TaxID=363832 RepID=UPI00040B5B1B|nr:DUF5808 domain-containing protein [Solirubrobacter soli]
MAQRGTFLGIPYDWRPPTVARFRRTLWNRDSRTVFVPKAYGWGYDVNLGAFFPRRKSR